MIIPNCCSILGQKYRSVLAELTLEGCQKHDDDPRKERRESLFSRATRDPQNFGRSYREIRSGNLVAKSSVDALMVPAEALNASERNDRWNFQ